MGQMSQIVPMVIMLGMNKYDLDEMGYRHQTEFAFVCVQLICLAGLGFLYKKIEEMSEGGPVIKVPEVKQMGQVVSPATEQTPKAYDRAKFMEQAKQQVMGFVVLGGVYYKWSYLMPLVLQVILTPLQLYESPLFQIHIMNKTDTKRPFPVANPFGLPSAPEAPEAPAAPAVESDSKEKNDDDNQDDADANEQSEADYKPEEQKKDK